MDVQILFTANPAARPNRRYTKAEWESMRPIIERMHSIRATIKYTVEVIEQEKGFIVSEKQVKDKKRDWGLFKNIRKSEMKHVHRIEQDRAENRKGSSFRVRDKPVDMKKLERWRQRQRQRQPDSMILDNMPLSSQEIADMSVISVDTPPDSGNRKPASPQISPSPARSQIIVPEITRYLTQSPDLTTFGALGISYLQEDFGAYAAASPAMDASERITEISDDEIDAQDVSTTEQYYSSYEPAEDSVVPGANGIGSFATFRSPSMDSHRNHVRSSLSGFSWDLVFNLDSILHTIPSISFSEPERTSQGSNMRLWFSSSPYRKEEELELWAELEWLHKSSRPDWSILIDTFYELFWILYEQGRYQMAAAIAKRRFTVSRRYKGEDSSNTLESLSLISNALRMAGSSAAADLSEVMYKRASRVLPGPDENLLWIRYSHAFIEMDLTNYSEAESLLRQNCRDAVQILLPDDDDVMLASRESLAYLLNLQGKHEESESILRQVVKLSTESKGLAHYETLGSRGYLVDSLTSQDKLLEAEEMVRGLFAAWCALVGPDNRKTAKIQNKLARILYQQGRFDECESVIGEVIEKEIKIFGHRDQDTLERKSLLFSALRDQEKYEEAEELGQELLIVYPKVLGENHLGFCHFLADFGWMREQQGRLEEALSLYERALGGYLRSLGRDHKDTVWLLEDRDRVYDEMREEAEGLGPRLMDVTMLDVDDF